MEDVELWDTKRGSRILTFAPSSDAESLAFSPDGTRAMISRESENSALWDAQTGKRLFELPGTDSDRPSTAFSPDGRDVLTGSRKNGAACRARKMASYGGVLGTACSASVPLPSDRQMVLSQLAPVTAPFASTVPPPDKSSRS